MAPTEDDRMAEASMLLRQALRLLDDDIRFIGNGAVLTDLAADLAAEAVVALRGDDGDTSPATADAREGVR